MNHVNPGIGLADARNLRLTPTLASHSSAAPTLLPFNAFFYFYLRFKFIHRDYLLLRYTIDPEKVAAFKHYARVWIV